jgi:hypothetical protein
MVSRTRARIVGLSLAALGAATVMSCGPKLPPSNPDPGPQSGSNRVSFRLFGYSPSEIRHMRSALNFQGKVFLARYDPANPERIEWVDCPTPARYRYMPSDSTVEELYIENETDLRAKLPLSVASFATFLNQGKRLRVRFATAGSFELADDFQVPTEGACGTATHFVQTISVGAYTVAEMSDTGAGAEVDMVGPNAHGSHSDLSRRNVGMGNLEACKMETTDAPPKDCQMPLEILMVSIGSHRAPGAPAPPPDRQPAPSPHGLPRPVPSNTSAPEPVPNPAGYTHTNCFVGVTRTWDPEVDLRAVTARCGPPLGLAPVGEPIVDNLAQGQPMHKYGANLEAGACYRIFAISDRGIEDLDTGLRAPDGSWVSKDILDDNFPILNGEGPFCVQQTGQYQLLVSVAKGAGKYAVQMWRVTR